MKFNNLSVVNGKERKLLDIKDAPNPDNINWENLYYSQTNRFFRKIFTLILTLILLLLCKLILINKSILFNCLCQKQKGRNVSKIQRC